MLDGNPSKQSRTFPKRALACGREVWRQISNPPALGLLGLALAITLWGYGYRLSRYINPSGSTPRIPAARLWVEQRFGPAGFSSSAAFPNLKARVYAQRGGSAVFAAAPAFSPQGVSGVLFVTARPRAIPFFHAAIPLRSPPVAYSL